MKVRQLLAVLKELDPDLEVLILDGKANSLMANATNVKLLTSSEDFTKRLLERTPINKMGYELQHLPTVEACK